MKTLTPKITALLVLWTGFVTAAFGNTTTLDTTFNGSGYRLQAVGMEDASGYSLAIQTDGKMIVAGTTTTAAENNQFALIRLNADGTLDTSFGNGGSAFSPAGILAAGWPPKVLIQSDGKILLSGTALLQPQVYSYIVLRFTSEGVLDTTFNNTGVAAANIPASHWDICNTMGLGADGKIVLVGKALTTTQPTDWDLALMRFNANGTLDTSFDGDGIITIGIPSANEEAHSVLIQADGKIIVGGRETTSVEKFLLMRLNTNGSTDTSFGTNGSNIFQIDFVNNFYTSLAWQSDGRLLAGGGGKVTRFTADGARDMTFARDGVQYATGTITEVQIRVIGGDKFYVGTRYGATRFMPNGAVDTNFNGTFSAPGGNCFIRSLAVQADGKAVVAGVCSNSSDNIDRFAVARFQENRTKRFLAFRGGELSEISIFRPSTGQWLLPANPEFVMGYFGLATDQPVPAEFTGDGKTDLAVFRPSTGEWFVSRSEDGTVYSFPFGTSGDIPVVGDFDEDQLADAGVFRPSTGQWFIQKSTGGISVAWFGTSGDRPVPSDYDGDFKLDIAIYRPSVGQWWIQRSSDGEVYAFQFGNSTDKPVQADYTGDNKTDAAFYRPSTGEWFVLRSEDFSYFALPFGLPDDLPTPGNFVGDARFDFAVFRPSTNRWHVLQSGGDYFYRDFGATGDIPLPAVVTP